MLVKLTYFKRTGKYYSEGSFQSKTNKPWEIIDDVRAMLEKGKLPGLVEGANEFVVLVNAPHHKNNVPCLIGIDPVPPVVKVDKHKRDRSFNNGRLMSTPSDKACQSGRWSTRRPPAE